MRKMSDPCTVPLLRVSVGNRKTQYYFSHQQRDALNTWGGYEVVMFISHHGSIAAVTEYERKIRHIKH